MEQQRQTTSKVDLGGGVVTLPSPFAVPPNGSPNAMDVKFDLGGVVEKRLGSTTLNATALVPSSVTGFSPDSGATLSNALSAYWRLEEQSGTRFDAFGGQDLTPSNSPDNATGIRGNALNFDAVTEFVQLDSSRVLQARSGSFTLTGWVYRAFADPYTKLLVGKGGAANQYSKDAAWDLYQQPDGHLTFHVYEGREASGRPTYFPGNASQTLTANLIAYWNFDEFSGLRRSWNGTSVEGEFNLTANSGVGFIGAGRKRGAAYLVAANSQYLNVANDTALQTGNIDWTAAGWVYLTTTSDDQQVLTKDSALAGGREYGFGLVSQRFRFQLFDGTNVIATVTSSVVTQERWHWLVLEHDSGANQISINVNNAALTTSPAYGAGSTPGTTATDLVFGGGQTLASQFFGGFLDEWGFWKKTFSSAERTALYQGGSANSFYPTGSIQTVVRSSQPVPLTTWTRVAVAFSSATSTMSVQVNTATATTALTVLWPSATSGTFLMGRRNQELGQGQWSQGGVASSLREQLSTYWKLEGANGSTQLPDEVSLGDLVVVDNGNVLAAAGLIGSGANFIASSSQYLSRVTHPSLETGDVSFTIAAWGKLTSTGAFMTLASKYGPVAGAQEWYVAWNNATNRFEFALRSPGAAYAISSQTVAINTAAFYLVVGWHDTDANTINIAYNNSATVTRTAVSAPIVTAAPLFIGADSSSGTATKFFHGAIDEVAFWKRTLTATERTQLYNSGTGMTYSQVNVDESFQGRLDEWGYWGRILTPQEHADLFGTSGSANTYNISVSQSGWGMFDFGSGFSSGQPLRWHVVAAGTGIYASSNRGLTYVSIATDRGANYQFFERSKSFLICTSDTYNRVLYWAGSVGTFALTLAVGSAPPAKHALDFAGFLLLMNDSGGTRRVTYSDNTKITTDPWDDTFEIAGSLDDEITGGIVYNRIAYVFTKSSVNKVSHVGGNPDFSVQPVASWGAVPGTIKKVTYLDKGEVIIALGWDRHVRIFDGQADQIISQAIESDNGECPVFLDGIPDNALPKCRAEYDTEDQLYRLVVVMSPSSETSHAVCLNLRNGAWQPYQNQGFNAMVMAESANSKILTGIKRDGFVHWINTTNTDAGTPIDEYYQSPMLFGKTPRTVSKSEKIGLYFSATSSGTLHYQDRTDFAKPFRPTRDRIALSDTTSVTQIVKVIDVPVTQNVYEFKLSSSASTARPWRLTRVDVDRQDLGTGAG